MANNLEQFDYFPPLEIAQGEMAVWKRSLDEFSPDEWDAQYRIRGIAGTGAGFNVDGAEDEGDFLFEATAAQTATMSVTTYEWQLWVTNKTAATETYQIEAGTFAVRRGFSAGTTTAVDTRSTAVQILEAIDAALLSRATSNQQEYEISTPAGSRKLKYLSVMDLKEARKMYAGIVARERMAERLRNGGSIFTTHKVRLSSEGA